MGYEIGYPNADNPEKINPAIKQGSTFLLPFTMDNFFSSGTPTIRATYQPLKPAGASVVMDATLAIIDDPDSTTVPPATLLDCELHISAADTATLSVGTGIWNCEVEGVYGTDNNFVFPPFDTGQRAQVVREAKE